MEILLDKRAVRHIRQSATAAIEDGDTETLCEDIIDAFSEDQVEEIERRIDGGDFPDFVGEAAEEWDGDDADEILELVASRLGEVGIDLKLHGSDDDDEDDDDDDDEDEDDDDFDSDEELSDSLDEDDDELD
jgi:hypothetical protein